MQRNKGVGPSNRKGQRSQLTGNWKKLLQELFETEIRTSSSAKFLITSHDMMIKGDKGLKICNMLALPIGRDDSGLSLAKRKGAMCFLGWINSVIPDLVIMACHQNTMKRKASVIRVSSIFLNIYQSVVVERDDHSRESL